MSEIWGIPSLKIGAQTRFSTTPQLNGKFVAYVFGAKHDIHNQASALETITALLRRLKMS